MTPDEVVARAKELVGERVWLTIEGVVTDDPYVALWELAAGYILAGEVWELDGLRPVRVVDQ